MCKHFSQIFCSPHLFPQVLPLKDNLWTDTGTVEEEEEEQGLFCVPHNLKKEKILDFQLFFWLFVICYLVEVDVLLGVPVVEVLLHDAGLPIDDGKHKGSQP